MLSDLVKRTQLAVVGSNLLGNVGILLQEIPIDGRIVQIIPKIHNNSLGNRLAALP